MCLVSKPKIPLPSTDPATANKSLPILRNPILDGMLGDVAALRAGTSAFRIDLVNPLSIPAGGGSGTGSGGSTSGGGGTSGGGSTGGGTTGGGGGGTGGGGMCVTADSFILMADGTSRRAYSLRPDDKIHTVPEETFGAPVEAAISAISFATRPIYVIPGFPGATRNHRFGLPLWLGRLLPLRLRWFRAGWLGRKAGEELIAQLTVPGPNTYYARSPEPGSKWRLSHNIKPAE